jgi:hypothetical protein
LFQNDAAFNRVGVSFHRLSPKEGHTVRRHYRRAFLIRPEGRVPPTTIPLTAEIITIPITEPILPYSSYRGYERRNETRTGPIRDG